MLQATGAAYSIRLIRDFFFTYIRIGNQRLLPLVAQPDLGTSSRLPPPPLPSTPTHLHQATYILSAMFYIDPDPAFQFDGSDYAKP